MVDEEFDQVAAQIYFFETYVAFWISVLRRLMLQSQRLLVTYIDVVDDEFL